MKKRLLRMALLGLAAVATLVAFFYAWTDWSGARHWKAVEAELRAKGEPLTIAEIEPQPIPDELNFAAAPIFAEIARVHDRTQWRISAIHGFVGGHKKASSSGLTNAARVVDPTFDGSDADAARVILSQTAKWKPLLDEVRAAAERPGTVWLSDYQDGFRMRIDQIQTLLKLAQALFAEGKAYLELGDPAAALIDFRLILNLASRSQEPPILIGHLVRQSITGLAVETVRFGIERHAWTPASLETIQRELAAISLLADLGHALRGERIFFRIGVGKLSKEGLDVPDISEKPKNSSGWKDRLSQAIWKLRPSGWSNEDVSIYFENLQQVIEWLGKEAAPRPEIILTADKAIERSQKDVFFNIRTPFSRAALPTILATIPRTVYAQATLDEAQLACAIERYRLAKGSLPATLASLQPDFLSEMPKDPINAEPFHYRITGADSYLLYSVGWNGVDDHGSEKKPSPKSFDKAEDWVWKMDGVTR